MARTTSELVSGVLGGNYDGTTSLDPFIRAAYRLTNQMATCASNRGVSVDSETLEEIETWLAAHFYGHADQFLSEKQTEKSSGKFQGQTGKGLESTQYGQTAIVLDPSGCLKALSAGNRPQMAWLGKPPSEQTDYVDRD